MPQKRLKPEETETDKTKGVGEGSAHVPALSGISLKGRREEGPKSNDTENGNGEGCASGQRHIAESAGANGPTTGLDGAEGRARTGVIEK
jgi:hypothetical protein